MRTPNMLLAAMLAALYGCQPETPAQPPVEPAMEPPVAAMTDAPPAAMPEQASEPAAAEPAAAEPAPAPEQKAAPMKKESGMTMEKPVAMAEKAAPVPAMAAPVEAPKPAAMPSEADVLALAKKNGCMVCHAIDKKVVGPSWKDVAAKYRGDAGAEARMMDKIAKGGSGAWGSIAMPPNPKLSEADRRTLARFVLSLK